MDVARQHGDRRRRGRAVGAAELGEELHERVERSTESRPVLQVEGAPHPLTEADAETTPRAVTDPLVPPLQVVNAAGHERWQRRPDEQMSGVGVALVHDPGPLVVVDDRAFPGLEHAPVAGVDHDEATSPSRRANENR